MITIWYTYRKHPHFTQVETVLTQRTLTKQLQVLESDGLLVRTTNAMPGGDE